MRREESFTASRRVIVDRFKPSEVIGRSFFDNSDETERD